MQTRSKSICNFFTLIALLASLAGGGVTYSSVRAAGILFAKPSATGSETCSSWANACTLQTAISLSSPGDEIWVQAGRHIPDPTNRSISFNLKNGVEIFGGFAGTETQRNQRNAAANVTILSGDLNGDDGPNFTNNGENSFHVVASINTDNTAILDGFTIRAGNANGDSLRGGGLSNDTGSPSLVNLTFSGNFAQELGGGMSNALGSPLLKNVTFTGNVTNGWGGGIYNNESNPRLTNVTFSGNSAAEGGGGMSSEDGSVPRLINVTFSGNSAAHDGGGLHSRGGSATLINTIIANSPSGGDCGGFTLTASSINNLIEDASTACGLQDGVNGNITGVDPRLGPLANYGGWSRTHILLRGSPAIDTGTNAGCPQVDQRRMPRPHGSQCDIGAIEFQTFRITGNAGAAGVKLRYTDGAPKTVTSQLNGNYSLTVADNWSGTVTPSHACYSFTPPNRSYEKVRSNLTARDYTPVFNPASVCAEIAVKINTTDRGKFVLRPKTAFPKSYSVNNGPVRLNGNAQSSVRFIASQQVIVPTTTNPSKYFEMMGLPGHLTSTTYYFPAYDNKNFSARLRIVNVGTTATTVKVTVGKSLTKNYPLDPNESVTDAYAGLNTGPLIVRSMSGVRIIASLIVVPRPNPTDSFSEMIGQPRLPQAQSHTSYLFPWFDNRSLDMQLRVANIGNVPATVQITIGGKPVKGSPFSILPNEHKRVPDPSVDTTSYSGLVRVISTNSVPIVVSKRVVIKQGSAFTNFTEMMGLPFTQRSAAYVFPWNGEGTSHTRLQITNVGAAATNVNIWIGAQKMAGSPFNLLPSQTLNRSFAVNKGPVVVRSTSTPVIASMRVLFPTSFSEMMGSPFGQLDTAYIFPWYDSRLGHTELRFAVP